jgi:hypothetical protein
VLDLQDRAAVIDLRNVFAVFRGVLDGDLGCIRQGRFGRSR